MQRGPFLLGLLLPLAFAIDVSAAVCSTISKQPADYNAPSGLKVRTTTTSVVDVPAPTGTWHIRSCHVVVNPPGGAAGTQTFDVDWTNATVSVAQPGGGGGPAPTTCDVLAGVGRIGATNLPGGAMTSECCFLAEISTNGCAAADASCTCDDPGNLIVDSTVLPNPSFTAKLPNSGSGQCGLTGAEVLGLLAYAFWQRSRRGRAR